MQLKQYLLENNMTLKELAEEIGYDPEYISCVGRGSRFPGKKLKKTLFVFTNGLVTWRDWEELRAEKEIYDNERHIEANAEN